MLPTSVRSTATILTIPLSCALFAQRSGIGLKGGLLMSTMSSEIVNYEAGPGATLGAYVPYQVGGSFEVQTELLLTSFGATRQYKELGPITYRTYYVQVPFAVKYFVSNTFNIHGGVQAGKRVMATTYSDDGPTNSTEAFNAMDFGLIAGAGLDLASSIDLSLRYYHGASSVLANDQTVFPRYRSVQFTVGKRLYRFRSQSRRRR